MCQPPDALVVLCECESPWQTPHPENTQQPIISTTTYNSEAIILIYSADQVRPYK